MTLGNHYPPEDTPITPITKLRKKYLFVIHLSIKMASQQQVFCFLHNLITWLSESSQRGGELQTALPSQYMHLLIEFNKQNQKQIQKPVWWWGELACLVRCSGLQEEFNSYHFLPTVSPTTPPAAISWIQSINQSTNSSISLTTPLDFPKKECVLRGHRYKWKAHIHQFLCKKEKRGCYQHSAKTFQDNNLRCIFCLPGMTRSILYVTTKSQHSFSSFPKSICKRQEALSSPRTLPSKVFEKNWERRIFTCTHLEEGRLDMVASEGKVFFSYASSSAPHPCQ